MTQTDFAQVQDHHHNAWRAMFIEFAQMHHVTPSPDGLARTWSWLCDPEHPENGLIITVDGDVVGFVHYRIQPSALRAVSVVYLDDLFVVSSHRGTGVADDVMDHLRIIAKNHGCSAVRWDTHATNARARAFYERHATNTNWITYEMSAKEAEQ